jgi:hypothetical protein
MTSTRPPGQRPPHQPHPIRSTPKEPKPFVGLIYKPICNTCAHATEERSKAPSSLPPVFTFTRERQRSIDTQQQFCPAQDRAYYSWSGRGNIRSNGHPGGKPWRQFQRVSYLGYFQQTHGTPLHGKRIPPQMLVWAIGALAKELGIHAVALVFKVDPHTVLTWLVEVADHANAFSRHCVHVAALYTGHGRWADRSGVDTERRAALSRATVAVAPSAVCGA